MEQRVTLSFWLSTLHKCWDDKHQPLCLIFFGAVAWTQSLLHAREGILLVWLHPLQPYFCFLCFFLFCFIFCAVIEHVASCLCDKKSLFLFFIKIKFVVKVTSFAVIRFSSMPHVLTAIWFPVALLSPPLPANSLPSRNNPYFNVMCASWFCFFTYMDELSTSPFQNLMAWIRAYQSSGL